MTAISQPDRRIRFRIGINIGDVIADGTDLHGDGVNIAARLEAECPVGGICVSRTVRDHVHGRLDLTFDAIGELTLKNIARPVEAFVVRLDQAAQEPTTDTTPAAPADSAAHSLACRTYGAAACRSRRNGVVAVSKRRDRPVYNSGLADAFTYDDPGLHPTERWSV